MVHLRAEGQGKLYIQELVNRFFEDAEVKIREHGVSSIWERHDIGRDDADKTTHTRLHNKRWSTVISKTY